MVESVLLFSQSSWSLLIFNPMLCYATLCPIHKGKENDTSDNSHLLTISSHAMIDDAQPVVTSCPSLPPFLPRPVINVCLLCYKNLLFTLKTYLCHSIVLSHHCTLWSVKEGDLLGLVICTHINKAMTDVHLLLLLLMAGLLLPEPVAPHSPLPII